MEEAIMSGKAMFSKATLKTFDARMIVKRIACCREQFEPDGIQF